jgi:hypothetical protein
MLGKAPQWCGAYIRNDVLLERAIMEKQTFPVVNVVVENLVVVNREVATNDKPAGAGKFKSVLASVVWTCMPVLVSEVHKWMSNLNIS